MSQIRTERGKVPRIEDKIVHLCKCGWWSTYPNYDIAWHEKRSGCQMGEQKFKPGEL